MAADGRDRSLRGKLRRWWPDPVRDLVMNGALASAAVPYVVRGMALSRLGAHVDRTAWVAERCWIDRRVQVGAQSFINRDCMIEANTTIGQWVQIAHGVRIITATHQIEGSGHRAGAVVSGPVTIGDGAWIGAGATILPGVTVGRGCVVAAGAVVTTDTAPDGLYVGVPARRVRDLPQ